MCEKEKNAVVSVQQGAPVAQDERGINPFGSEQAFIAAQRMAQGLSYSSLIPDEFSALKGNKSVAIANCLVAMNTAYAFKMQVTELMRWLYIVHGRPAFSTAFLLSRLNDSGKFSPLEYIITRDAKGKATACHCEANEIRSGVRVDGPEVSLEMAKAERWGSKWATMPEVMLRYRAATFFIRLRAPEVLMGYRSVEEEEDADASEGRSSPILSSYGRENQKRAAAKRAKARQTEAETPESPRPRSTPADFNALLDELVTVESPEEKQIELEVQAEQPVAE